MMNGMHRALYVSILAALLGLGACSVPDPCDPGFNEDHGVCIPVMPSAPDAGGGGDGGGDGDGDGDDEDGGAETDAEVDAASEPMEPEFPFICPVGGDPAVYSRSCTTNADCECPASICLPAPLGHCTGTQCMEPGKECPDGTCIDIAPFRDGASIDVPDEVTHICL